MPTNRPSMTGTAEGISAGSGRPRCTVLLVCWVLLGGASIVPRQAWATDGIEPIGFSTQSLMRGGTDVAIGDSALSQIDNPATLTLQPRRLDTSWELLMPRTRWDAMLDADVSESHIPIGHIGVALPYNEKLSFGLAAYSKSQLAARFRIRPLLIPLQRQVVDSDLRNFALSLNAAYKLTEELSLGFGVRAETAVGEYRSIAGPARLDFGQGCAIGGGFQAGVHYKLRPDLSVGAAYRSATWFQHLLGTELEEQLSGGWGGSVGGFIPINLGNAIIRRVVLPQRISAGVAWDATPRLRLSGEARWLGYSGSVMDRADFVVTRPIGFKIRGPVGYDDQWVLAVGAEYKLDDRWTVACGYHYASNPIRSQAMLPQVAMIVEHHITLGLRYQRDGWWFGGGYILGLPNTLRAGGRTRIPFGIDYAAGSVSQVQHSLFAGFGFTW